MTDNIKGLVERLREDYDYRISITLSPYRCTVSRLPVEAADLIERQAARIAESETHRNGLADKIVAQQTELGALRSRIAELERIAAGAEPVAEVIKWQTFTGHTAWDFKVFDKTLEHGAKLYSAPVASGAMATIREALEATFEQRPGFLTKVSAAIRALPPTKEPTND